MTPAGLAAFEARTDDRSAVYSYEQRHEARLDAEQERRFRAHAAAWEWFQSRPPSFRRAAIYWVTSAKKPETRERRLADADRGLRRRAPAETADAARQPVIRSLPTAGAARAPTTAR